MSDIEDIKSRLDIVDVLGDYISLRPAGSNLRAICPFHSEKSPSFMVSPDKQIWHCFGCGQGGDIFAFVMGVENIGFGEALKMLANKAGVVLKKEDVALSSRRSQLIAVMEAAREFYQRAMLVSEDIKNYLKSRGLKEETVRAWQIGYSPDSFDDLILHLKSKKFSDDDIFSAGLSIKKEGTGRYYNRFRDRIMFPINDASGQIMAFTARLNPNSKNPEADKMGKYINSPQTQLYDKSRILFGLDKARSFIKASDLAVVVEGQMDVISSHQNGQKNVVASSGTALTFEQLKMLRRYTLNLGLAFDNDQAGALAQDRGLKEALLQDFNVKIISIPGGKDPDDSIKSDPSKWPEAIKSAEPVMDYYWSKIFNDLDLNNVASKRQASKNFFELLSYVPSNVEVGHWLKKLSERLDIDRELLKADFDKIVLSRKTTARVIASEAPVQEIVLPIKTRLDNLSESFLSLLVKYPVLLDYAISNLEMVFLPKNYAEFYNTLIIYYNEHKALDYPSLRPILAQESSFSANLLDTLAILGDRDFSGLEESVAKRELIKATSEIKKIFYKNQMILNERELSIAEEQGDQQKINQLMSQIKDLSAKIQELDF